MKKVHLIYNNKAGFTFIELLIVMAILVVMFAVGYPTISNIRENIAIKNNGYEVVNVLRLAQNRSVVSQDNINWGVHFNTDNYILYGGDWSSPPLSYQYTYNLNNGITVTSGAGSQVLFNRLTGETSSATIILTSPKSKEKIISIDPIGKISIN
ncbi:prepilin-type N-terminal cleavage/methylation domain-containing protein [Patescibacteria group bacterium]|nr:prepilin-type N-terminal cleavage/methylation domain-containing protein [Patescibacteria group bacterium]